MTRNQNPRDPRAFFPERLRALRRARGFTLAHVARIAGLSPGHLSKLERQLQVPTLGTLQTLAIAFGIDAMDLIGDRTKTLERAEQAEMEARRLRDELFRVCEEGCFCDDNPYCELCATVDREKRWLIVRQERPIISYT